ncbi:MAG: NAD(P)-dependent alcohol dehydrogenase [bacterium]|nr:NAD(P)-dependent alcohol dehydrogenase [bacterium]MDE0440110.1 NAD(P)-dependent alcohol dehydrogenase [bacterium]
MKAAVLLPEGGLEIEERPEPSPGPDQVLVAPRLVGVCGSDLHYYKDGRIGDWRILQPHVLGHEFAGVVVAVGSNVENVEVGDRIAVEPIIPCGDCDACTRGIYNVCPNIRFTGSPHTDGALQELVAVPARGAHRLPPGMPFSLGALVEPTSIAVHAVRRSGLREGDTVMIVGAGPIGLLTLAVARAYGAGAVYCTDLNQGRLDLATRLGATAAINVGGLDHAEILGLIDPLGVDISFEAVGTPGTLETAMRLVRPGGTVVAVGVNISERIPFNLMLSQSKEATVVPVYLGRDAFPEAVALLASGRIDGELLISHRFPLERAREAMETSLDANTGAVKVMIRAGADDGGSG